MELEEKKSAAPEASLPMPELPADIPAEVRRKLAEDLSEEATEDLKQDVRDAEEEEARDEEVKARTAAPEPPAENAGEKAVCQAARGHRRRAAR